MTSHCACPGGDADRCTWCETVDREAARIIASDADMREITECVLEAHPDEINDAMRDVFRTGDHPTFNALVEHYIDAEVMRLAETAADRWIEAGEQARHDMRRLAA